MPLRKPGGRCPFNDPDFSMSPDDPCPLCGMYGDLNAEDKCVDSASRDKLAPVAQLDEHRNSTSGDAGSSPAGCASYLQLEIEAALDVADIAADLVALWENQKISGLPRSERNAAIDGTRQKLTEAVHEWQEAKARNG